MSDEIPGVFLSLPLPEGQIFRYRAADDILELLYRNPHREFTVSELRNTTGHGGKSVDNAIQILGSLDLIRKEKEGRRTLIHINQERARKPDDPLFEIVQSEFREPVREFLERAIESQGDNLVGVILFGSVARGEADRASDIDLLIVVRDDLVEARRELHEIRQEIENEQFGDDRYELQVLVESTKSARNYGGKLRDVLSEGIVLHSTDELTDVKEAVFDGK